MTAAAKGRSIASVYSVRRMPGAPVSTPLDWDEVNATLDPAIYTMEPVLDRLEKGGREAGYPKSAAQSSERHDEALHRRLRRRALQPVREATGTEYAPPPVTAR